MPRTRAWDRYPINRLFLSVGVAQESWLPLEAPVAPAAQPAYAARLARYLGLDRAVQEELLRGYAVQWDQAGRVRRLRLFPHPRVYHTPGLAALRRFFGM